MGGHQEPKSPAGPDAESSSAETTDKLPPAEAAGAHIAKNLRPTPASAVDMVELNIPVEAPQKLGSRLSKAKLAKDQDALYVLRNEHGAVLKVGKTSEKAIKGRFSVYKRAGKLTDIDVQVEVYPLDMKALATSGKTAEAYEAILRASMEGQESMPWDNTGGRLGRPGFGTPGEGIRKSPITLGEMRELLEWYKGNKAKIGEELGVHARTVDLWAKSLGLIPKDFKPGK